MSVLDVSCLCLATMNSSKRRGFRLLTLDRKGLENQWIGTDRSTAMTLYNKNCPMQRMSPSTDPVAERCQNAASSTIGSTLVLSSVCYEPRHLLSIPVFRRCEVPGTQSPACTNLRLGPAEPPVSGGWN